MASGWLATFKRFPPGSIRLGFISVRVADWSKPRPGRSVLFDQSLFERFAVASPLLPILCYAPIGFWLPWRTWQRGHDLVAVMSAYVLGLVAWSLLEYIAHRGAFHHDPQTPGQVAYGYVVHGVHHAYPDDSRRWMLPLVVSLPIAVALFALFHLAFGALGDAAFGALMHGYLVYDLLHYFIHKGKMPTRLGRYLRQYHLAHHYATPDRHYGVSSPLWDVVFRTR